MNSVIARGLKINGIVQGVGFRPFVYNAAHRHRIRGSVANTSEGVVIHAEGDPEDMDAFIASVTRDPPPLSRITGVSVHEEPAADRDGFRIETSLTGDRSATLISPDAAVCDACLAELFSPENRRHRYPFINCTHCGPRYTIIDGIPYDRPNTSMKTFIMCPECQAEYDDPGNRRFHAQPNACPVCGPRVSLHEAGGGPIAADDPVSRVIALLKEGRIVAVKGLGGFHLAVDAENDPAVRRLRDRKHREEKPFALMARDLPAVRRFADPSPEEESLLVSRERPIVLLPKKETTLLAASISPGNRHLGVMLPYTPLHHLLFADPERTFSALVMTSGNLSEEPIVIDNPEAFRRLGSIADYILLHDRDIYLRSDDSIQRFASGAARPIRRSRGYAPAPIFLSRKVPPILACGAELKSVICITREDQAFLSQHIGDLENLDTDGFFRQTATHLKRILDVEPEIIAHDLHPDYLSTQYAREQTDAIRIGVQHHHAHIAACLAENQTEGPVIGLAFDGSGWGLDRTVWGGEVFIATSARFERAAHLALLPLPGAAAAIREPWRMGLSYLHETFRDALWDLPLPFMTARDSRGVRLVIDMIRKRINSPPTSSLGRLFDGVAAIIGLRGTATFEGQAAMELEMIADPSDRGVYGYEWSGASPRIIDWKPIIRAVAADLAAGVSPSVISRRFHGTLIRLFTELTLEIRRESGVDRVAFSGGVFQNMILFNSLAASLQGEGFEVLTHRRVPANDGGISLGQAWVAAALMGGGLRERN